MDLVSRCGIREAGGGMPDVCREPLDFANGALAHFYGMRARWNLRREKIIPPRARIADALQNSRKPNFQGRTWRVGQHERKIEVSGAQFSTDRKNSFTRSKRD